MRLRVGYCSTVSAKIAFASLSSADVSVSCNGQTYTVPMIGRGNDNPARPGVYAGYAGHVEITGLSPFTVYTFTATQDEALSGSFRTLPTDSNVDWSFMSSTCENFTNSLVGDYCHVMRDITEAADPPVLFYCHHDDLQYFDAQEVLDTDADRATTGLPDTTALSWDWACAWLNWYGVISKIKLFGTSVGVTSPANNPDRQWVFRNLPLWAIWGDHEIEGDHCRNVYSASTSSDGCNKALEAIAEAEYDAFCSDACTPPKLRDYEQYWGVSVGPVRFAAYDSNLHSQPFNACDSGDTHTYGRVGTNQYGTCAGATTPTRTQVGVLTDTAPADFLGATQVNDLLNHYNNPEPFKILFCSTGISRQNQPWADRWPVEWDDFCARASVGIMQNPYTNGTSGQMVFIKGDTHGREVNKYTSDGSSLGGVSGKTLWEVNPGTLNGSWMAAALNPLYQNGRRVFAQAGKGATGDVIFGSFMHVIVYGSRSPKEIEYRMVDSSSGKIVWSGYMYEGQGDNDIRQRPRYIGI